MTQSPLTWHIKQHVVNSGGVGQRFCSSVLSNSVKSPVITEQQVRLTKDVFFREGLKSLIVRGNGSGSETDEEEKKRCGRMTEKEKGGKWRREGPCYRHTALAVCLRRKSCDISHCVHLPALPCCSLINVATDRRFTHALSSTSPSVLCFVFFFPWRPAEPTCHCSAVIRFRSGCSAHSPYGFPYNVILREIEFAFVKQRGLNQQREGAWSSAVAPHLTTYALFFSPPPPSSSALLPTALMHGDTLYSKSLLAGILQVSLGRALNRWVGRGIHEAEWSSPSFFLLLFCSGFVLAVCLFPHLEADLDSNYRQKQTPTNKSSKWERLARIWCRVTVL